MPTHILIHVSPSDGDFVIGPCPLQRPGMTAGNRQQQARDPGTQGVIRKEDLGPVSNSRKFQGPSTLVMREEHGQRVPCDPRQVTGTRVPTPPLPLYPPTRASWADPLHPPPEDTPFPQVNYSSETGLGKTSLRPPNLHQRSRF